MGLDAAFTSSRLRLRFTFAASIFDKKSSEFFSQTTENNLVSKLSYSETCDILDTDRFDCWPEKYGVTQTKCEERGCCWKPSTIQETAPYCFHSKNYSRIIAKNIERDNAGIKADLYGRQESYFSNSSLTLRLSIEYLSSDILRIKVSF